MTWEIVAGIISLLGVFGLVAGWTAKLSRALATLDTTIKALNETITTVQDNNRASHKDFYKKLDDHEIRIVKLEDHAGK